MPPKAKMTIRFDPPPTRMTPVAPKPHAGVDPDPVDDAAALERLIRQSGQSGQAFDPTAEQKSEPTASMPDNRQLKPVPAVTEDKRAYAVVRPDREPPDMPDLSDSPIIEMANSGLHPHQAGPAWWKVTLSAASAIATGALFGLLVLSLFSGQSPESSFRSGEPVSQAVISQTAAAQAESSPEGQLEVPGAESLQEPSVAQLGQAWPAATWYWLQYGVFRSQEAMEAAAAELADAGLPGFSSEAEDFRVFAGVAATKEMAEKLASQMPGRELYIKPITMPEIRPAAQTGSEEWRQFIVRSEQLSASLSSLSIGALQDELPQPAAEATLKALRETYSSWQQSTSVVEQLKGTAYTEGHAIIQALSDAMASVDQYENSVSRYHLWRIQAQLMNKLAAEQRLRAAVMLQSS